jgi:hypothetical protein
MSQNSSLLINNTNSTNNSNLDIISKQKLDIKKLAQMVKDTQTKSNETIITLKEEIEKKDEENRSFREKLKHLEKSNNDVLKNIAKGKVSEVTEVQKQYENEILVNKELIKTYINTIKEKNQEISKFSEEVIYLRNLLEEEKKKSEFYLTNMKYKLELKSSDVEIYKLMTENSALKTKLINLEENLDKKADTIEKLKEELNNSAKNYTDVIDNLKIQLNLKEKSYSTLIKDYYNTTSILNNLEIELEKNKFLANRLYKDIEEMKVKHNVVDKENIDLKAENENIKTKLKGKDCEVDILAKKLKETELKVLDYKLSKQIFNVRYNYLKIQIDGSFIMKKEENNYYFVIENKTSTRTLNFLEVDLRGDYNDPNKIFVRFLRDNKEEEYFYNDVNKIIDYFEDFRRKAIEVSSMFLDNKANNSNIQQDPKRKVVTKEKIKNLLEF